MLVVNVGLRAMIKEVELLKSFIDAINQEIDNIKGEIESLERRYPKDDGYFLEIKKNRGKYTQFYKCKMIPGQGRFKVERTFIKRDDIDVARRLAQKDFDFQLLKILHEQLTVLNGTIQEFPKLDGMMLYNELSDARKALIDSIYIDDQTFIDRWLAKYNSQEDIDLFKEKYPIETSYYTDNGEHVRSKSEKIIADKFAKEGIPYVYEPVCELNRKGLHPDFALLNKETRKTYFYEHFGMMDKPEYATVAVKKIAKYRELGYEYGKNLLYSFETGVDGLNINDLNRIILENCK